MQEIYVRTCAVCGTEIEALWKDVSRWLKANPGRPVESYLCPKCAIFERNSTHGQSKTNLYSRWKAMFARTRGQGSKGAIKHYLDKGISVCPEWYRYEEFQKWAESNGFKPELVLDRIDSDGNYEPSNCRWVTQKENNGNRNWVRFIERCREAAKKRHATQKRDE
jgi:hypothetical protein